MQLPFVPRALWWLVVPFVVWRVYVRLKRLLARQQYSVWKHGCSVLGLTALAGSIAYLCAEEHASVAYLAGGLAIGAALGAWSLRLTRFEPRAEGMYFTPDRYIGGVLSAILVCRIVWRLASGSASAQGWSVEELVRNESTLFLFGLLSGQYIIYAAGLSVWALHLFKTGPRS